MAREDDRFGKEYFVTLHRDREEWHERLREEHDLILRLMRPRADERILDVGCGKGRLELLLKDAEPSIDMVSSDVTNEARQYISGTFVKCSMTSMPFPDSSFDKIFCMHVIAHFEDGERGIREAFRVLKPGGKLLILTPNKLYVYFSRFATKLKGQKYRYDRTAAWLYTTWSLKRLLSTCRWSTIEQSYFQDAPRTLPFEWMRAKLVAVAQK